MTVWTVGEAAGASVDTVLGNIGDAVAMAALDSALADGLARHCGWYFREERFVHENAVSMAQHPIRTAAPLAFADVAEHAAWAHRAFERFGRGSGSPARLNYGDCMAYAAAKVTGEPLLFVGDDFTHTDLIFA